MNCDSPLSAIDDFVKILNILGISYCLGGSFASSLQGEYRATNDLDFLCHISLDSIDGLNELLKSEFIVDDIGIKNAVKFRKSFNIFHELSFTKIDVFTDVGIFEREQLSRAIETQIPGCFQLVKVCSPEDIILAKMRWYLLGKQTSQRQLADINGVIKIQQKLDQEYIKTWSYNLGLDVVYNLVFKE